MAKEPVLKTGARKRMWVRVPPPPFNQDRHLKERGPIRAPSSLSRHSFAFLFTPVLGEEPPLQ